jgi:hypothetical protein
MSGTPILPNRSTYGATDILAPNVSWWNNRNDYLGATGQQASAFTAGQPVKRWVVSGLDLSDPKAQYQFNHLGLDSNGNPAMLSMSIPASVAAVLNIQGTVAYQSYAAWLAGRAPTAGTVDYSNFGNDIIQPMDLSTLFTPDEATALAGELSSTLNLPATPVPLVTPDGNPTAHYNYDPNDNRRIYDIQIDLPAKSVEPYQMFAMGSGYGLFAVRNAFGVGAPGTWSWTTIPGATPGAPPVINYSGGPRWTLTIPADGATEAREYPVPVRALVSPPEKLVALLGNVIAVERTDLMPSTGMGSGLTDAQAASLADIQAKVTALWGTLPPSAQ